MQFFLFRKSSSSKRWVNLLLALFVAFTPQVIATGTKKRLEPGVHLRDQSGTKYQVRMSSDKERLRNVDPFDFLLFFDSDDGEIDPVDPHAKESNPDSRVFPDDVSSAGSNRLLPEDGMIRKTLRRARVPVLDPATPNYAGIDEPSISMPSQDLDPGPSTLGGPGDPGSGTLRNPSHTPESSKTGRAAAVHRGGQEVTFLEPAGELNRLAQDLAKEVADEVVKAEARELASECHMPYALSNKNGRSKREYTIDELVEAIEDGVFRFADCPCRWCKPKKKRGEWQWIGGVWRYTRR